MIHGALAAAVTPLTEDGAGLDEDAFGPIADFLAANGIDGILALGTTGEGILLDPEERRRAAELYLEACRGRLDVAVHCGAQTTAATTSLAAHAAEMGAAAVAVIPPPYFPLDDDSLFAHLAAAASACAPVPFFLYEFEARAGYPIPLAVVERLRSEAPNLAGLKVSDTPFERVEPYIVEGLDVFVGSEPLLPQGLAAGAAGTVSGLAAAFPEYVARLYREPGAPGSVEIVAALRDALQQYQFNAAVKAALAWRGVPVTGAVRAPLRGLSGEQRAALETRLEELTAAG
ncbi:MAG TPA: dihydrodipicolinate synthase family protein [Gaiellaceae bacterium]|nr:dihydrodipicolinate synthase family protein [Gaiellaceae bacterium]